MGFLRPLQKLRNINVKNHYNQLALVELINAQEMEGVNQERIVHQEMNIKLCLAILITTYSISALTV